MRCPGAGGVPWTVITCGGVLGPVCTTMLKCCGCWRGGLPAAAEADADAAAADAAAALPPARPTVGGAVGPAPPALAPETLLVALADVVAAVVVAVVVAAAGPGREPKLLSLDPEAACWR